MANNFLINLIKYWLAYAWITLLHIIYRILLPAVYLATFVTAQCNLDWMWHVYSTWLSASKSIQHKKLLIFFVMLETLTCVNQNNGRSFRCRTFSTHSDLNDRKKNKLSAIAVSLPWMLLHVFCCIYWSSVVNPLEWFIKVLCPYIALSSPVRWECSALCCPHL